MQTYLLREKYTLLGPQCGPNIHCISFKKMVNKGVGSENRLPEVAEVVEDHSDAGVTKSHL